MGLGNGSSEKVTYVRMMGLKQEETEVYFAKNVKKDGNWTTEGNFKDLEGQLKSVKFESKETEKWGTIHTCKVEIVDDQTYVLDIPLGASLGRSIVNSLASKEKADLIKISLYINKSGYKSAWIELDGEAAKWVLSIDDQKALTTEIKDPDTGKVEKRKYTKLISKLQEMCNIQGNANAKPTVSFEQAATELDEHMNATYNTQTPAEWEESDLPF